MSMLGIIITFSGIAVLEIVGAIGVLVLHDFQENREKRRRDWADLVLHLRAPFWSARHPTTHRQYRAIGVPTTFRALLVSRIMTVDQAHRLGWDGSRISHLVSARGPYANVPEPPLCDVEQLIRWAQARPGDDGAWLAGQQPHRLARLTEPQVTENALDYLTADLPRFRLEDVAFFVENTVPYATFWVLNAELRVHHEWGILGPTPEPWLLNRHEIARLIQTKVLGHLEPWEVAGWLSYDPAATRAVFRESTAAFPFADAETEWLRWHPVNQAAGPGGPHAVFWWAAGYTAQETLEVLATGNSPDLKTLATMAALRGDDWRQKA